MVVNVDVVFAATGREAGAGGALDAAAQVAHQLAAGQPFGPLAVVEPLMSRLMVAAVDPAHLVEQNFAE